MADLSINSIKSFSIFKTLYENGTASKAAQLLGITQSGVSRSLSMLEDNIGFPLFLREKNRLIATPEAAELYKEVLRLMLNLDETKHSILALREFGASRFRIAAIPGLAFGYIPRIISQMVLFNSKINVSFDILSSNEIVQAVEAGSFDIGFVTMPIRSQQLNIDVIEKTQAVCIMPKDHILAEHDTITLNDLNGYDLVVPNQPNLAADCLLQLIVMHGIDLSGKTEANIASICSLVSQGLGVSVINPIT
ncbi:MAG: LysR family transcriptional regulator, partial [Gammaproteobacteria bacterium]